MLNSIIRCIIVGLGFVLLTGCATQSNIPLADSFWQNQKQEVTVAVTKAPKPQVYQAGEAGLLDYAINTAMCSSLDNHLSKTDLTWYNRLPQDFSNELKQRHVNAKYSSGQLDPEQENYANFASQTNSDKLLIVKLEALGARRNYAGFIPTEPPRAYCVMTGKLIDAKDNQILWRYKTTIVRPVEGTWDQPPNYPNFDNALKLAINSAKQELLDSFFSGH